ncbi:MAG: hypothetical protein ACK521_03840 [bacterium]
MAKIFKTNNERSENRNTVMNKRQLFDASSTQMPLVSTFMTNFPDEKQLLQMTRKERHFLKKERTRTQNIGSIIIGKKVNIENNDFGLPMLPAPQAQNAIEANNLTF